VQVRLSRISLPHQPSSVSYVQNKRASQFLMAVQVRPSFSVVNSVGTTMISIIKLKSGAGKITEGAFFCLCTNDEVRPFVTVAAEGGVTVSATGADVLLSSLSSGAIIASDCRS